MTSRFLAILLDYIGLHYINMHFTSVDLSPGDYTKVYMILRYITLCYVTLRYITLYILHFTLTGRLLAIMLQYVALYYITFQFKTKLHLHSIHGSSPGVYITLRFTFHSRVVSWRRDLAREAARAWCAGTTAHGDGAADADDVGACGVEGTGRGHALLCLAAWHMTVTRRCEETRS